MKLTPAATALGLLAMGAFAACSQPQQPQELEAKAALAQPLAWKPATSVMASTRCRHAAAALGNGRVLVCGGGVTPAGVTTASCDIYTHGSSDTGSFSAAPVLPKARSRFTLTATGVNAAVAVGGLFTAPNVRDEALGDALRFAGSWTALPNLGQARRSHRTVSLGEGQLLVVGGVQVETVTSDLTDEYWNGLLWQSTLGPSTGRIDHTATVLPSGEVVVVGGSRVVSGSQAALATYQVYTPATNRWSAAASMLGSPRRNHSATLLPDGDVLVVGGRDADEETLTTLATVVRYRPSTRTWSAAPPMSQPRGFHAAELIQGKVVVTGGNRAGVFAVPDVEVYDPEENRWIVLDSLATARMEHTLTRIDDDHLLVAGGCGTSGNPLDTAEVLTVFELGRSCNAALRECFSGYCVDGNCCESACNDRCHVCEDGACTPISGAPRGGRPACENGGFCRDGTCNAACSDEDDCQSAYFCDGGTCSPDRAIGASCTEARQCGSGRCIDGRCCDAECGQCEACDVPGDLGHCIGISGEPRPARERCPGSLECGGCNPTTRRCEFQDAGSFCSDDACSDGIERHVGECDGQGNCSDQATTCGSYTCDADGKLCLSRCSEHAHCAEGFFCEDRACVPRRENGQACSDATECASGHCIEGVCCEAECESGTSCATAEQPGLCRIPTGSPCEADSECGSDHCVDGVCCADACEGVCEACDTEDNLGQCVPIVGPPRRDPSVCGGPAACEGADLLPASECDGQGSCSTPVSQSCFPYRCAASDSGATCPVSCSTDAECADDYTCRNGECLAGGYCLDELTFRAENGQSRNCHPYRCEPDGCRTTCRSVADCAEDHSCDRANNRCIPIAAAGTEDEGCACAVPGRPAASSWGWSALAAALLLRLRRARPRRV